MLLLLPIGLQGVVHVAGWTPSRSLQYRVFLDPRHWCWTVKCVVDFLELVGRPLELVPMLNWMPISCCDAFFLVLVSLRNPQCRSCSVLEQSLWRLSCLLSAYFLNDVLLGTSFISSLFVELSSFAAQWCRLLHCDM